VDAMYSWRGEKAKILTIMKRDKVSSEEFLLGQ
jgi:hypothetical protein